MYRDNFSWFHSDYTNITRKIKRKRFNTKFVHELQNYLKIYFIYVISINS